MQRLSLRVLLLVGALIAQCAAWVTPVHGAEPAWKPQKNVELVVGAQAGGSNEQGYDVVASTWFVVFGPKGLSPSQVAYWEDALGKAMRHPETRQFVESSNWTVDLVGARQLPTELDKEYARLRSTLTELGIVK